MYGTSHVAALAAAFSPVACLTTWACPIDHKFDYIPVFLSSFFLGPVTSIHFYAL